MTLSDLFITKHELIPFLIMELDGILRIIINWLDSGL